MRFPRLAVCLAVLQVCAGLCFAGCGDDENLYCAESTGVCFCSWQPLLEDGWEPRSGCNEYRCPFRVPETGECYSFILLNPTDPNAKLPLSCSDPYVLYQGARLGAQLSLPVSEPTESCP